MPTVLIVIVNWNGKMDLLECLASIEELDYPAGRLTVLVVDNASADGSQAAVSEAYPEYVLIENDANIGYARAVNQGIERGLDLGVDYVWVFNNDVVVDKGSLRKLVETGEQDESIGVIGPVIYSGRSPDEIDHAGYSLDLWTGRLRPLKYGRDVFASDEDEVADADSVLGCSNLIRTPVFEKIGLFRTIYGVYFEETDFNLRARRAGFRVVVAKNAKVVHKGSATMNKFILRRAWLLLRNLFLFEVLNARPKHLLVFIPYFFLLHVPYFLVRGGVYAAAVKLAGSRKRNGQVAGAAE